MGWGMDLPDNLLLYSVPLTAKKCPGLESMVLERIGLWVSDVSYQLLWYENDPDNLVTGKRNSLSVHSYILHIFPSWKVNCFFYRWNSYVREGATQCSEVSILLKPDFSKLKLIRLNKIQYHEVRYGPVETEGQALISTGNEIKLLTK